MTRESTMLHPLDPDHGQPLLPWHEWGGRPIVLSGSTFGGDLRLSNERGQFAQFRWSAWSMTLRCRTASGAWRVCNSKMFGYHFVAASEGGGGPNSSLRMGVWVGRGKLEVGGEGWIRGTVSSGLSNRGLVWRQLPPTRVGGL